MMNWVRRFLEGAATPESRRRIRRLGLCGMLAASILVSLACPLPIGEVGEFPSTDQIIVCTVVTSNQGIESEEGASAGLPIALSSDAGIFLDEAGTPVRNYYLARDCLGELEGSRWGADSVEEAEADWARFVRQRIEKVAAAGGEETVFARYPESVDGWCGVETTLSCQLTEIEIGVCVERGAELTTEVLPVCPPFVFVEPPEDPPPGELVIESAIRHWAMGSSSISRRVRVAPSRWCSSRRRTASTTPS